MYAKDRLDKLVDVIKQKVRRGYILIGAVRPFSLRMQLLSRKEQIDTPRTSM